MGNNLNFQNQKPKEKRNHKIHIEIVKTASKNYKWILLALLDAKEAFPASARLAINDYKIDETFLEQTKQLMEEGARIDIVGDKGDTPR